MVEGEIWETSFAGRDVPRRIEIVKIIGNGNIEFKFLDSGKPSILGESTFKKTYRKVEQ